MKKLLTIYIFILFSLLTANEISYLQKLDKYPLYNRNTKKYYNYLKVKPGEKLEFKIQKTSEVRLYSRIFENEEMTYSYELNVGNDLFSPKFKTKMSKVTYAKTRNPVSQYEKMEFKVIALKKTTLKNTNSFPILVRVQYDVLHSKDVDTEFTSVNTCKECETRTLIVKNESFEYYSPKNKIISFEVQGPAKLKILSRMIFTETLKKKSSYKFTVYDNGKSMGDFSETAYKSEVSYLKNNKDLMPSTADVNILTLGEGTHKIEIENKYNNRDIIFNFYKKRVKK